MHDSQPMTTETVTGDDPLGPVATMPAVTFGAREAALAGVGTIGNGADQPPTAMFTWHITCTSLTFASGGSDDPDQP